MTKIPRQLAIVAALVLSIPMFAFGVPAAQQAIYAHPIEPKMTPGLNLGKMNYEAFCASCHGMTAGGTDKGPTFISRIYHPGHHGDAAFLIAPKEGARAHHWQFGDMPPVRDVSEKQLETIIEYVRAVQRVNGLF